MLLIIILFIYYIYITPPITHHIYINTFYKLQWCLNLQWINNDEKIISYISSIIMLHVRHCNYIQVIFIKVILLQLCIKSLHLIWTLIMMRGTPSALVILNISHITKTTLDMMIRRLHLVRRYHLRENCWIKLRL